MFNLDILIAKQQQKDLLKLAHRNQLKGIYRDGERRPRISRHWANAK